MLEKNIGPLTKAMIHGGSFSFGHISSISYEKIINCCYMLMHKRGVHYLLSMLSRYGCPQVEIYEKREIKCDVSPWTFVQVA